MAAFTRVPAPSANAASAAPFLTVGASGAQGTVYVAVINNSAAASTGLSDNSTQAGGVNAWSLLDKFTFGSLTVEIYGCTLTRALVSADKITAAFAVSHNVTMESLEFSGQTGTITKDVSLGGSAAAGLDTSPAIAAQTGSTTGDVVIGVTANDASSTAIDVDPPAGYTAGASLLSVIPSAYMDYLIAGTTAISAWATHQWGVPCNTGLVTLVVAALASGGSVAGVPGPLSSFLRGHPGPKYG